MNITEIMEIERKKKLAAVERTPLNTLMEGEKCCARAFAKLGRGGLLDKTTSFTCEKCGQEYRCDDDALAHNIRRWAPHVWVELRR
jgi:hypothetical protein